MSAKGVGTAAEPLDALCPIFLARHAERRAELIGSGTLLWIGSELFLLTAAHVIDRQTSGALLIPGRESLVSLSGYYSELALRPGASRAEDRLDVAYVRLTKESRASLHEGLHPLRREQVKVFDGAVPEDVYSFAGFPWRKARRVGEVVRTPLFSYGGSALAPNEYRRLGYDPNVHLLVQFRRRRSVNPRTGLLQIPPLPHGISGGGVYAWPKDYFERHRRRDLSLVGITHTYLARENILVGTRINFYIACVLRNNPELAAEARTGAGGLPMLVGVAWYEEDQWGRIQAAADDTGSWHRTWNEWRAAAEISLEQMAQRGWTAVPVLVTLNEIRAFHDAEGQVNDARTRSALVNAKLGELGRERFRVE